MKAKMLKNLYEGLNARSEVYLSKEYFCEMYRTCPFSKLCEFIQNLLTAEFLMQQKKGGSKKR